MKTRIHGSVTIALLLLTASLISFGGTPEAGANDGSPLVLGNPSNTSQSSTNLIMDRTDPNTFTTNAGAIQVVHAPDSNDIFPIGILAQVASATWTCVGAGGARRASPGSLRGRATFGSRAGAARGLSRSGGAVVRAE
jgi:hypothetical protein